MQQACRLSGRLSRSQQSPWEDFSFRLEVTEQIRPHSTSPPSRFRGRGGPGVHGLGGDGHRVPGQAVLAVLPPWRRVLWADRAPMMMPWPHSGGCRCHCLFRQAVGVTPDQISAWGWGQNPETLRSPRLCPACLGEQSARAPAGWLAHLSSREWIFERSSQPTVGELIFLAIIHCPKLPLGP